MLSRAISEGHIKSNVVPVARYDETSGLVRVRRESSPKEVSFEDLKKFSLMYGCQILGSKVIRRW